MSAPATAAPDAILIENLADWRGQDVVDPNGDKLGKLEEIYYDGEVDRPAFAAVKSGTFGKHVTLVPLTGATVGRAYLRLRHAKKEIKGAPSFDTDQELSLEDEQSAYRFYGLDHQPTSQGGRRLAKR